MMKLLEVDYNKVKGVIEDWHNQYGIPTGELDCIEHATEYLREFPDKLHSPQSYCLIAHSDFFIKTPQDI